MRYLLAAAALLGAAGPASALAPEPLVTGKLITPQGKQTNVGSFPANLALSPDGRYAVVTNTGFRQFLTVLSTTDGKVVSQLPFNGKRKEANSQNEALYYGLAFGRPAGGSTPLYVSRGHEGRVTLFTLDSAGKLTDAGKALSDPNPPGSRFIAGIALNSDGSRLYAVDNHTNAATNLTGEVGILDTATGKPLAAVRLPGYTFAAVAVTKGPGADKKVYVSSERDSVVSVVSPDEARVVKEIGVGDHPLAMLLDAAQTHLFVANSGSDTVSVVDTATDVVTRTILLRPDDARGLPGATPTGLALSPDEKRLYVTLADMNAVAVVDVPQAKVAGYIPVGWYPTAVVATHDGKRLLVSNARGVAVRNPNKNAAGPNGAWTHYIPRIIEGTVSLIDVPNGRALGRLTAQTLTNNMTAAMAAGKTQPVFPKTGIEHVIYIIKENRTYDQVLGDLKQGNGDESLCTFPRKVTPNLHAIAERFALFDNYYCCAEVSADGWVWSVSGMESEYANRNTPTGYSGRGRPYDEEGENGGLPVDLLGVPDVAMPPSGYIWDLVARKGLSYRNYGFYVTTTKGEQQTAAGNVSWKYNTASKGALVGHTNDNFLQFDMRYADSDAWMQYNCPAPAQMKAYGANDAPCRFAEWKRDFDEYVKSGDLPRFMMVRLPRDHTAGTSAGASSPRAMVADNDYAVGRLVEEISKSPFWPKTAIFIVEDDAQDGWDHVDAHRSTCYVISPWVKRATVDHRFYNTDSTLRTMEILMGLPPLCQYDAAASPLQVFGEKADNLEPFKAILPDRDVIAEVNQATAYRAADSAKLDFTKADAVPDGLFNDILWHALMGEKPLPPARYGLRVALRRERAGDDD